MRQKMFFGRAVLLPIFQQLQSFSTPTFDGSSPSAATKEAFISLERAAQRQNWLGLRTSRRSIFRGS